MIDPVLLFELLLLLVISAVGLALFESLRLPAIVGFLVVGALAGPGGLQLVDEPERVRSLAELGVVFLLFEIGLELPLERMRTLWRTALIAGGAQVALTVVVVAAGASALGVDAPAALVLGGIIAMSSTALAMRLLVDQGSVDAPHGRLAVAILVLQDLAIVLFLLAIPLLSEAGGTLREIGLAIARMGVALGAMLLVTRGVVPRVLDRAARLQSYDLFSLLALIVVLGSAFLAEMLGLTLAVGAFLAGVAATASPYSHQLFSEVVPLRGVLIGLFFTAVGMLFEPTVLLENPGGVLAYVAAAMLLKGAIIVGVGTGLAREGRRSSLLAAAALAQTGEFSFVLAESARVSGLLDPALHQVVIAGSILSLLATPFLLRAAPALIDRLSDLTGHSTDTTAGEGDVPPDRVIIIGFGHAGQTVARTLRSLDIPYEIAEANARGVEAARERGEPIVFADATRPQALQRLGVAQARVVVIAISDPLATRRIVSRIEAMAPQTRVIARTRYVQEVDLLERAGAAAVIAEEYEGAVELVARTLGAFPIPSAAVRNFTDALREEGYGAIRTNAALPIDPWLVELLDQVETDWVEVPGAFPPDLSLGDLDVRAQTGASILAIERHGATIPNPGPDQLVGPSDRVLVLGDSSALARLAQLLSDPQRH